MFEAFGFETVSARWVSVLLGLGLGAIFGMLAQRTRFCFRRAMVADDWRAALGLWLTALAVAILGTQAAVAFGWIDFADHRFMAQDLPVLAITLGGLVFGMGMVLARGCPSRLSVLCGAGNLRALLVLVMFALVAHATLKGLLVPVRVGLGAITVDLGAWTSVAALPGGAMFWSLVLIVGALAGAWRSGNRWGHLLMAAGIGALVPLAWVGTGFVLHDPFEPIPMNSLSFTAPVADTLFYAIASSSIAASFGPGFFAGTLLGAMVTARVFGEFQWQSFESVAQTKRYITGAVLMGIGGVSAGGCTIGAGLSGVPTLSFAALLAIVSIALGAQVMQRALRRGAHP